MQVLVPYLDTSKPPGEQLAPEMRAEIAEVAPSAVTNGSITEPKLAERSVSSAKLALGAALSENIGSKAVKTANLDDGAVGAAQLANDSVTPDKAGTGVVTAYDADGNAIESREVHLTAAEFALITARDPNTTYYVR